MQPLWAKIESFENNTMCYLNLELMYLFIFLVIESSTYNILMFFFSIPYPHIMYVYCIQNAP